MVKKKFAGYINLKNLNGVLYPSSIQNVMMKEFIQKKLGGIFYLSPTEILHAKFPITLRTLLAKETKVEGIVMLSSFYLPESYKMRKQIYKESIKNKKPIYFMLDEMIFKKINDQEKVENFIMYNHNFFTDVKLKLNKDEIKIAKKFSKVTFV